MPELPEVQTVVTTLRPRLLGRSLRRVRVLRADIIEPAGTDLVARIQGRRVSELARRGKKIVFTLDSQDRFYIHLGMTGHLTIQATTAALAAHTHLVIDLGDDEQLRFTDPRRFGGVWWLGRDGKADIGLGPEPLELKPAELLSRLSRTRRVIKTALLDQKLIAGIGNIYADEALHASGIHPLTPANRLSAVQVGRLCRAIKQTLNRALRHKGSTLRDYRDGDGKPGNFQKLHRVYDRAGQPCRKCRTLIVRLVIGGRSSHFCPTCQPMPR